MIKIIIALVSVGFFSTVSTAQEPAAKTMIAGQVVRAVVIGSPDLSPF